MAGIGYGPAPTAELASTSAPESVRGNRVTAAATPVEPDRPASTKRDRGHVAYLYAVTEAAAGTAQALWRSAQWRSSLLVARHSYELPSDTRASARLSSSFASEDDRYVDDGDRRQRQQHGYEADRRIDRVRPDREGCD